MPLNNGKKIELEKKYHLDKSHLVWEPMIDNWFSVEAFRQQTGKLPNEEGARKDTAQVMMDFLDNDKLLEKLLGENPLEFGSMYLSAKRWLYRSLNGLSPLDK